MEKGKSKVYWITKVERDLKITSLWEIFLGSQNVFCRLLMVWNLFIWTRGRGMSVHPFNFCAFCRIHRCTKTGGVLVLKQFFFLIYMEYELFLSQIFSHYHKRKV